MKHQNQNRPSPFPGRCRKRQLHEPGFSLLLFLCFFLVFLGYCYFMLSIPVQPFSRTTWVSRHYQSKPFWILLEREMMGWQWHQLDHMQIICTSRQTDNHVTTSPVNFLQVECPSWLWSLSFLLCEKNCRKETGLTQVHLETTVTD